MTPRTRAKRLDALAARIRVCPACPLCQSRTLAVPGEGAPTAKVMIIGEAPGKDEDRTGKPFVGSAGRYLDHVLEGSGIDRSVFFITNIVKCRPEGNRAPRALEVDTCVGLYLERQIELIQPELIVLLGSVAAKKLLGAAKVDDLRGRLFEQDGRRYLVTYHPAVRFYREDLAARLKTDFELLKTELARLSKTETAAELAGAAA